MKEPLGEKTATFFHQGVFHAGHIIYYLTTHIIPFSVSYNDDIRNGMSLCKSHHWAFDTGLISVSEAYRVIVSPAVTEQGPTEAMITALRDKSIGLPEEMKYHPDKDALAWHRKNVMRG